MKEFREFWGRINKQLSIKKWVIKNKQKVQTYQKRYRENNKNRLKHYQKKYYQQNYSVLRLKDNQYHKKHREQYREHLRKYRKTNIGKIKHRIESKNHYKNNKNWYKQYHKTWSKENKEKMDKYLIKHTQKLGVMLGMTSSRYKTALSAWSRIIRNQFNNQCQICFKKATHTHHIFEKSKYPKLSLIINNGIPLCLNHHYEVHGVVLDCYNKNN